MTIFAEAHPMPNESAEQFAARRLALQASTLELFGNNSPAAQDVLDAARYLGEPVLTVCFDRFCQEEQATLDQVEMTILIATALRRLRLQLVRDNQNWNLLKTQVKPERLIRVLNDEHVIRNYLRAPVRLAGHIHASQKVR